MTIQQDRSNECACRQLNDNGGIFTERFFRLDMFLSNLNFAVFAHTSREKHSSPKKKNEETRVNK